MKTIIPFLIGCVLVGLHSAQAADASPGSSGFQLSIELRDGSHVIGKTVEDTLSLHSASMGDMKLPWSGIRTIEYASDTGTAKLTATNGDIFVVQLTADTLPVQAGFGKTELPVNLIRNIKVAPAKPSSLGESGWRLTVELRDGSHIIGKGLDEAVNFHSGTMGDLKLAWSGIRSIEYASVNSDVARLTATNNDVYEVQFASAAVTLETGMGKTELPVNLIRSIKVSAMGGGLGGLPSGVVALWSGEGDGNDSVGGNTATLTDISFVDGQVGQAFSFNGTTSSIKIPASQSLDIGKNDGFTITAWIKPSDVHGIHPIMFWPDQGDNSQIELWISAQPDETGVLRGNIPGSAGNGWLVTQQRVLTPGVFQHIAMTYDKASGMSALYVNGVMVAQHQLSPQIVVNTKGDLEISHRNDSPGSWSSGRMFSGLMDEVAIYNRALSASEIQDICTQQNHGAPLTLPTSSTGWLQFMR